MRWRTLAGFLVLITSLVFFIVDAYAMIVVGSTAGLQRPAWALFAVAVYFFFGVWVPAMLQQRRDNEAGGGM